MRGGFFLAGGADADITGLGAELGQRRRAEVAHAALHPADERAEHVVDRAADFLESLNTLGGHLAGLIMLVVTVACGAARFHGGEAAHAPVLFINFSADFHDFAGRFPAAGEQATQNDGVGQRQGFDDIAALGDAAVGDESDIFCLRGVAGDVERGELRDTHAGDDAGGADGAGTLADLDGGGPAIGEERNAGCTGDIACNQRELGERVADELDDVADSGGLSMSGGYGDRIDLLGDEMADVFEDFIAVE